jgi:serine phosphatase RsbU (regulator of sigma subunit)
VRPVLRAYALDGHAPCRALAQLDRLMKESERREMTTLFHLRYDPDRRRAEYVRAGHPPGLVRTAAGEVIELDGGGTPPLGILDEFECNAHTVDIPAGSLVLLYTDGLIERRDTDLAAGLERLKRSFAEAPAKPTACLDWLEAQLETDAVPDDVAMLAMST